MSGPHIFRYPTPDETDLPPYPDQPDCCNGGCAVCVLEGWPEEVAAWKQQVEEIRRLRAEREAQQQQQQ
ncbi:MAG TPA: oxidoreductase-like domain-containing protein [Solimonas sp.]|nr:oxidoreductase-like domain-containing protein [Solimonas sp.]